MLLSFIRFNPANRPTNRAGWVPPMMFFGFADALTSTLDFPTVYKTVRITGRETLRNLLIGKI